MFSALSRLLGKANTYVFKPFLTQYSDGSVGRILLSVSYFTCMFRYWIVNQNPPDTLMQVLFACMAYIFGGKVLDFQKAKFTASVTMPTTNQTSKTEDTQN